MFRQTNTPAVAPVFLYRGVIQMQEPDRSVEKRTALVLFAVCTANGSSKTCLTIILPNIGTLNGAARILLDARFGGIDIMIIKRVVQINKILSSNRYEPGKVVKPLWSREI
jgi:hypothetical protein